MAWLPGYVEFDTSLEQQDYFEANIQINKINAVVFHGVVTENDGKKPAPGALVKVFARTGDQREWPLSHTICGHDGHYLLYIDKETIPDGNTEIIVRASAGPNFPSTG